MSLQTLMVRTIEVLTAGSRTDAYGDTQPDWATATVVTTQGWLAQQSSFEDRDARNATSSTLTLTLPADTVITARNRVRIDAITYELVAEPLAAWTPHGEHHRECMLQLVRG